MTMIVPEDEHPGKTLRAIYDALRKTGKEAAKLLVGTHKTWKSDNIPKWSTIGPKKEGPDIALERSTTDTPYVYVDDGTPPRIITATPGKPMVFQVGGKPKTRPGSMASGPGMRGGQWKSKMEVNNPGIKARDFSGQAAEELEEPLADNVQKHLDKI